MNVRTIKPNEAERIFELFKSASLTKDDLPRNPSSGFYEYPLTFDDIAARLKDPHLCLALEDGEEIISYMLGYDTDAIRKRLSEGHSDPVWDRFKDKDNVVFIEQNYLKSGVPLFVIGRLADAFDYLVQNERYSGVLGAIPQKPWRNASSIRFATCRGFRRDEMLDVGNVQLGLYSKPYYFKGSKSEFRESLR